MGVVPPAGAFSWLATVLQWLHRIWQESSYVITTSMPSMGIVWSTPSTPSVAPVSSGEQEFSGLPLMPVVPMGRYMGEGLLPIAERLT